MKMSKVMVIDHPLIKNKIGLIILQDHFTPSIYKLQCVTIRRYHSRGFCPRHPIYRIIIEQNLCNSR